MRVFESDPSNLDISFRSKVTLFCFFYLGICLSGYAAARAGNLADYGGGRWLYYSQKIINGEVPFLDFTLDHGPLYAYLCAGFFYLFGQNLFALQLELNLIFPLIAFVFYHLISLEAFRDYRFRYGFLCLVWVLNLSYLPSLPAIAVPAALLSVILLVRGWKQGDYFRLLWSAILSALLLYTDPYIGVCAVVTNIFITIYVFLFFDIPYNRRLLKFLILFTSFLIGIAFINLFFYEPEAVTNYISHFKALYLEHWVWYLGTPPSSHTLFALFFLVFFSHLSIFYFRLDKETDKLRKFLPLFAVIIFSALSFFSLFYQSKDHHFFTWFPTLLTLFFLLSERYFLAAIPHAFSTSTFRLKLSTFFPKLKTFQLLGHENFAVLGVIIAPPLILFLLVVGPYSIHRTAVSKYIITSLTAVSNPDGIVSTEHMEFNRKEGVWMDRSDLHDFEQLEDYLKLNVRLYEETVFLPQALYGSIAGFSNKTPFYSVENTFLHEYRDELLNRWELFKPAYIVIDTQARYVHHSEDYLLQKFDAFVEKHYYFEKQLNRYKLLRLRDKDIAKTPYKSLNHNRSQHKKSTLLLQSNASFALSPVAAVDITYTYDEPQGVPSFLYRPFLRVRYYRGKEEVAVKYITVPYSSRPLTVRVKLRHKNIAADRVTVRIAERAYSVLKPRKADLLGFEVFALKSGFQSFSGISVLSKE